MQIYQRTVCVPERLCLGTISYDVTLGLEEPYLVNKTHNYSFFMKETIIIETCKEGGR